MTTFEEIRGFIRSAVLDSDCDNYRFSDNVLDQHIRFDIVTLNNDAYAESLLVSGEFNGILTSAQKGILSLRIAIRLLLGHSSEFSYKTPVLSITRKQSQQPRLVAFLQNLLDGLQGGKFAIAVDTDFDALIQGFDRYLSSVNIADAAWAGD